MGHGNQPIDDQPGAAPVLRGSDGWDYYSLADKLLGQKALTTHNISRIGAEQTSRGKQLAQWAAQHKKRSPRSRVKP